MRRYATGLQLVLLVCAGAASGYLWRAALDPRSTVAPSFVLRSPDPTWLFVKPQATPQPRATASRLRVRAGKKGSVLSQKPANRATEAAKRRRLPAVKRQELHPSAELASVTTPSHTVQQTKPAQSESKRHKPRTAASRSKRPNPRTARPPATPPPSPPASPAAPVAQQAASNPSTKPGWGKGDGNHDHTGPPGQSGKGNSKK